MFDLFRSRDKVVRWVLGGLMALVGLSMVTYLIPSMGTGYSNGADTTVVATIGKEDLTSQEVSKQLANMTRSRQMPPELLAIYVPQIVDQMISERAMAYEANRLGLKVTSDETENAIVDSLPPQLVKDGKVDSATLNQLLSQQGSNMAQLKDDTGRQLQVARLRQIVGQGVIVTPAEINAEFHKRSDKVRIQYAVITPAKFQSEAEPSEADVKAYYEAHKGTFQTAESRDLGLIIIDPAKLNNALPSDDVLRKLYNSELDQFRTPERVNLRHILVKSDASNDAAKKAKAESLLKQIQSGGDFAKLAKENSDDPGSGANGGELGWIVRGQTVPEFEKAAFTLKPGETSGLIKTVYGYHILQVEQHEQAHLQPFEEVKGQLTADYMKQYINDQMQKLADQAESALRKDPAHPDKLAAAVGGEYLEADKIRSFDPVPGGVGVNKDFNQAIIGLKKGEVAASPVQIAGNKVVLATVLAVNPAHPSSYEEAKADAKSRAIADRVSKLVTQKAADLAAKAKANGGDLEKAGKELGIEVKTSPDVDRNGAFEGVGQASSLPDALTKPVGDVFGPDPLTGGGLVVGKVIGKFPGDATTLAAQTETIRNELRQQKTQDRIAVFQDGLNKRLESEGKLKRHQDVIARLVQTYSGKS